MPRPVLIILTYGGIAAAYCRRLYALEHPHPAPPSCVPNCGSTEPNRRPRRNLAVRGRGLHHCRRRRTTPPGAGSPTLAGTARSTIITTPTGKAAVNAVTNGHDCVAIGQHFKNCAGAYWQRCASGTTLLFTATTDAERRPSVGTMGNRQLCLLPSLPHMGRPAGRLTPPPRGTNACP